MMKRGDLGCCEVKVMAHHFQGSMPQYLLERKYITTIKQIVYGEGMPAKVSM